MIKKFIQKRIEKLTIQDIYDFATKNGISLKENEAKIIYSHIQQDWEELIFQDHKRILKLEQDSLEHATYEKIEELIVLFKNKYKNYL